MAAGIRANTSKPDVWVADSSAWLQLLEQDGVEGVAGPAPSIARSPLLLALPPATADALGWLANPPSWREVIETARAQTIRIGITPPDRDIASRLWLLGLMQVVGDLTSAEARRDLVGTLLTMDANQVSTDSDLLAQLTRDAELAAVPLPEHAIISLNADAGVPLVAAQLNPPPVALDYPYAVLSQQPAARGAANRLRNELTGDHFRQQLAMGGLRGPDGAVVPRLTPVPGAPIQLGDPAPTSGTELAEALDVWSAVTRPGRILAVIDASGSMGEMGREEVATEAADAGLARLSDEWAVGLWIFSTERDGLLDHELRLPIRPLTDQHREDLRRELSDISPQGGTGLYDTVVAAYEAGRTDRDPTSPSSPTTVVIFTDGRNEDDASGGRTLSEAERTLRQAIDATRPIQLFLLGIPDAEEEELRRLADAAGGDCRVVDHAADIEDIFVDAIAQRLETVIGTGPGSDTELTGQCDLS